MRQLLRTFLACSLGAMLAAQDPEPAADDHAALPIREWLSGEPVQFTGANAAKLCVLAFLPAAAALPDQQEALAALQRRHAEAGLRVVALLPQKPAQPLQPAPPFAVALGLDGGDAGEARRGEPAVLCLFDGQEVLWQGTFANGPDLVIANALSGKLDRQALQQLGELRGELMAADDFGFEYGLGSELQQRADALLALNRTDGAVWALRYCVANQKLADAKAAAAVLRDALAALTDHASALGWFCDVVLRSDPFTPGLGEQMWPLLTQAAPMAPADATLQLAALQALVRAGKGREVGRRSQQLRKQYDNDATALMQLAGILAGDRTAAAYRDVAEGALQRATALGASSDGDLLVIPQLLGARYRVLRHCAGDEAAARKIVDALVERLGQAGLNDCAWYSMVRLDSRGRCDELASALCRRMLERKDQLPGNELDTTALGMYLDGEIALAVELQQAAMQKLGVQKQEYEERLHRYQAALPPQRR